MSEISDAAERANDRLWIILGLAYAVGVGCGMLLYLLLGNTFIVLFGLLPQVLGIAIGFPLSQHRWRQDMRRLLGHDAQSN